MIAYPVEIERSDIAGVTLLKDASSEWLADVNSREADEIAARLNAADKFETVLKGLIHAAQLAHYSTRTTRGAAAHMAVNDAIENACKALVEAKATK